MPSPVGTAMWLALDSVARCAAAWQRDRSHCSDERGRAAGIAAAPRREQFLAGRWLAAAMLAEHIGGAGAAWRMSCEPGQAPRVYAGPTDARPRLSIAHRDNAVACAISMQSVGVDIEVAGRLRGPANDYAELVLSPAECADFAHVAPGSRDSFLLDRWTLKEAWAKAAGHGLALGDMPNLSAQPMLEGGNARLWRRHGLVLALCADDPGIWPQPAGGEFDAVTPAPWNVSVVARLR